MSRAPRIAVALDTADVDRLRALADLLGDEADLLKVGLEAVTALGPQAIAIAAARAPVFADLKLHDIPHTVAGAAAAAAGHGASMLTVHAAGGPAMVRAAVTAAPGVAVVAVTILTSLDGVVVRDLGMTDPADMVLRLAASAGAAGAAGIVCAGDEVRAVRATLGPTSIIVVPGIRPEAAAMHDQSRVVTPRAAMVAGADVLVVGRPVTSAPDPVAALRRIRDELGARRPLNNEG